MPDRLITVSLLVLSPILSIMIYKGLFGLGKFIWTLVLALSPKSFKLSYKFDKIIIQQNEDAIYVLTAVAVLYLIFIIVWILI